MQKKLLYIFPESHLVICCCCRMSVQTGGSEWQCPGAGSQCRLSGCQREEAAKSEGEGERAVSQVVPPVYGPLWWREGGRVSGFVSYCQPKLVFREQKCQLIWHVFCLPAFPNTHLNPTAGHLLVIPLRMQNHKHTDAHRGGPEYRGCSLFQLNVARRCNSRYLCPSCRAEWNGACPYICLSYVLAVLLWAWLVSVFLKSWPFQQMERTARCV